jgi:hypothetical protein
MKRTLLPVILGIVSSVCALAADQVATNYLYKGFDTNGTLLVEGNLTFNLVATNEVRGRWNLRAVIPDVSKTLGPQTGSGAFNGHIDGININLNLNPDWADNNVILDGRITATNISGAWGFYGFAGQISGGKFEAVKK